MGRKTQKDESIGEQGGTIDHGDEEWVSPVIQEARTGDTVVMINTDEG